MNEINFIPIRIALKRKKYRFYFQRGCTLLLCFGVVLAAMVLPLMKLQNVKQKEKGAFVRYMHAQRNRAVEGKEREPVETDLLRLSERYNGIYEVLRQISCQNESMGTAGVEIMDDQAGHSSGGVNGITLQSIVYSGATIALKGAGNSFGAVVRFCRSLRAAKATSNMIVSDISAIGAGTELLQEHFAFELAITP